MFTAQGDLFSELELVFFDTTQIPPPQYRGRVNGRFKARQGVILLFDHQDQNFNYFHNTIA